MKIRAACAGEPGRAPTYCLAHCCQALCLLRECGMEKISEGQVQITREEQNVESIDHQFVPLLYNTAGLKKVTDRGFSIPQCPGSHGYNSESKENNAEVHYGSDTDILPMSNLHTHMGECTHIHVHSKKNDFIIPNVYMCIYIITKEKKLQK